MKIAVFGAKGRVGSRVCEIAKMRGHEVVEMEKDTKQKEKADIAIDFSTAVATHEVCEYCRVHCCALVSGVTGRTETQQAEIDNLRKTNAVVEQANFSKGMNVLDKICQACASLNWDCALVETHRKGKIDRPSGTAKRLATVISQNGTRIVEVHSLRQGDTVGKHEIVFCGTGESITVIHEARSVDCFALGAVEAAEKVVENR